MYLLIFVVILLIDINISQFSPDTSDCDAYGIKIAGNEIMLIEALNDVEMFVIQFLSYNNKSESVQCPIMYNDTNQYIYSIGIGNKQNISQRYFFYGGEFLTDNTLSNKLSNRKGSFIGILINKDLENSELLNCNYFEYKSFEFISSYDHQEFFVFDVEPYGQYAIGIAKDFAFIYRPFSINNRITIKNSSFIWPNNVIFIPIAIDTDILYTIVGGFIINGPLFRVRGIPTVYVISNINLTILSTWSYTAIINSWQSYLTYPNLKFWSNKYLMSININSYNSSKILIGMPFLNIVFLLIINLNNNNNLIVDSFIDNGNSIGFGKSVTWLSNYKIGILISNYLIDNLSKINLYELINDTILSSSLLPSGVYPNIQQRLPSTINHNLIQMISILSSLVILNIDNEIIFILSSPPGYFSSIISSTSDSIVLISQSILCMSGTYKNDDSIFPCILCPSGTRNPGYIESISCIICSSNSFCPIGSIIDINNSYLLSRSQAYINPRSSEVTVFDEILLQNMFSTSSNDHCLFISPLFWVLLVIGFILFILFSMSILKKCVEHPKGYQLRHHVKKIFRRTDLIHEGEMWVGGLLSFAAIVLLIFAYTFSATFYREYPSETMGPTTYSCNELIRNVKYENSLQSLSIPVSKEEEPMFDLLNQQHFKLHLDFLNTIATCQNLFVEQIFGLLTSTIISNCTNLDGILSVIIELPYQKMIIKYILNDIVLIGGVRISIQGDQKENHSYKLKKLDFSQTFYDRFNRTLAQMSTINLELTKAINETELLIGHETKFSGIWYPSFVIDDNHMFISSNEYATLANLTSTKLTIIISETSYYIKNRQLPIAKLGEIIFHDLLFTLVSLELFRLIILLYKLIVLPLSNLIMKHIREKKNILSMKTENINPNPIIDNHNITTDDHDSITIENHDIIIPIIKNDDNIKQVNL